MRKGFTVFPVLTGPDHRAFTRNSPFGEVLL